jgi:phytoene/squalene synthetase
MDNQEDDHLDDAAKEFSAKVSAAICEALAEQRRLFGAVYALCAVVEGLARASPNPDRALVEIRKQLRGSYLGRLGEIDDDRATEFAHDVLRRVGDALGGHLT